MLFERIEDKGLSHYSYAVGCVREGVLAIVDPRRDIDVYLELAAHHGMEIRFVLETHIHADYASGARELSERTGAQLCVSRYDAGETFEVSFPHRDLEDGDEVTLGNVRLRALHTPGHTPEHLSFLVFDEVRHQEVPMLMLSGDFLFVGSLGRPDLLGDEAKRGLAEKLFTSVRETLPDLPDGLEVHPAHGAGSMCGAGMSGRPFSTLGFERMANPYLDPSLSREQFVEKILSSVPPFPPYYRRMKAVNSKGPRILGGVPRLEGMPPADLAEELEAGRAVAVDLRGQLPFGEAHVPGSFGIGGGSGVSTWASWMVPYDQPIFLIADAGADLEPAVRSLIRVGLDDARGFLDGGFEAWLAAGLPTSSTEQLAPGALRDLNGEIRVVDVRTANEYAIGHVEGATHLMGGDLATEIPETLGPDDRIAVICNTGYRSTVAASVLERAGFSSVANATGGMVAWEEAGLPVVRD